MSKEGWRGWERMRERGERYFVWVHGVLGWGLPMAVLWTICRATVDKDGLPWTATAAIALPLFMLGGYVWGKFMWRFLERKYRNAADSASP